LVLLFGAARSYLLDIPPMCYRPKSARATFLGEKAVGTVGWIFSGLGFNSEFS